MHTQPKLVLPPGLGSGLPPLFYSSIIVVFGSLVQWFAMKLIIAIKNMSLLGGFETYL
jgi:hypothetical protein